MEFKCISRKNSNNPEKEISISSVKTSIKIGILPPSTFKNLFETLLCELGVQKFQFFYNRALSHFWQQLLKSGMGSAK